MLDQKFIELTLVGYGLRLKKIQEYLMNDPNVTFRKHMITNFIKRNNVRARTRQRNCERSKEPFCSDLIKMAFNYKISSNTKWQKRQLREKVG